jgi:hypothetical protein
MDPSRAGEDVMGVERLMDTGKTENRYKFELDSVFEFLDKPKFPGCQPQCARRCDPPAPPGKVPGAS